MGYETENCILDLDIDFLQETNSLLDFNPIFRWDSIAIHAPKGHSTLLKFISKSIPHSTVYTWKPNGPSSNHL